MIGSYTEDRTDPLTSHRAGGLSPLGIGWLVCVRLVVVRGRLLLYRMRVLIAALCN